MRHHYPSWSECLQSVCCQAACISISISLWSFLFVIPILNVFSCRLFSHYIPFSIFRELKEFSYIFSAIYCYNNLQDLDIILIITCYLFLTDHSTAYRQKCTWHNVKCGLDLKLHKTWDNAWLTIFVQNWYLVKMPLTVK